MLRRFLVAGLAACAVPAFAADWPQFRGPAGNGISTETKLPAEWSEKNNLAWKVTVPGVAWSCPIVVGETIYLTTAISEGQPKPKSGYGGGGGGGGRPPGGGGGGGGGGPDKEYEWKVIALDRKDGSTKWTADAGKAKPKYGTHGSNTFATETPVADAERVYAYFAASGWVYAFDLKGKEVWKKEIGAFAMMNNWGTASSPILHDGKLIVQCDNEQKSFLIAFDAKTGEQKWKVDRKERTAWSTPYVWTTKDRTDLVVGGPTKVIGYDPANGKVIWELAVGGGQANASPVGDAERLYFGTGVPGGGRPGGGGGNRPGVGPTAGTVFAVKAGAMGDITPKDGATSSDGVAWTAPKSAPAAASPLVYDGYLYLFERNGGLVSCFEASTGKAAYTKERIPNAGAFWASPWAYDGKVFAIDETGTTHVLKAGKTFEVLHKNSLGKDLYWSSPAIADGKLFIRSVDSLNCIK